MQTLLNILVFLLILTGIIVIHELGHFVAAKFFKVYCGAFSIGMGPKIYGKKGKRNRIPDSCFTNRWFCLYGR